MYNFILTASRNNYDFLLAIPVLIVFVQGNPTGIDKPYSNSYSIYAEPIQSDNSFFSSSSSPPLPTILPKSITDVNFVAVGDWDCSLNKNLLMNNAPEINYKNTNHTGLKVETVFTGIRSPTNFAFLGANDILVLEKNTGTVRRITDGKVLPDPLLDVAVANKTERGLLGIAVAKNFQPENKTYVFLYYTESKGNKDATDICPNPNYCEPENEPLGNRLYRYELAKNDSKLVNPKLLLNLPAIPGPGHNGGEILIGPDKNLYVTIGDVMGHETKAQNVLNSSLSSEPDGTGGILRITQDGKPVLTNSSLGDNYPLDLYYAYGIRNSFGLDFDPLTGNLWDTENGPDFGDEINLVDPGFNSGWKKIQGIWRETDDFDTDELVNFGEKGKYSEPEFSWGTKEDKYTVAPTALKFFNSTKYGKEYENDMFVADANNGILYHFDLNEERTKLVVNGTLEDNLATNLEELEGVTFGRGFRGITDLQVGPDGYLYLSSSNQHTIYRIVSTNTVQTNSSQP
jgi:aldose sugar dehydrogenase